MRPLHRVLLVLAAAVIVGCAFLEWGNVPVEVDPGAFLDVLGSFADMTGDGELGESLDDALGSTLAQEVFAPQTMLVHVDGWHGFITVGDVEVRNIVAVLAGVIIAVLSFVPAKGRWPAVVGLQLAAYGTFHLGWITVALSNEGSVLPAGWATLVAFVAAGVVLVSGLRDMARRRKRRAQRKASAARATAKAAGRTA